MFEVIEVTARRSPVFSGQPTQADRRLRPLFTRYNTEHTLNGMETSLRAADSDETDDAVEAAVNRFRLISAVPLQPTLRLELIHVVALGRFTVSHQLESAEAIKASCHEEVQDVGSLVCHKCVLLHQYIRVQEVSVS